MAGPTFSDPYFPSAPPGPHRAGQWRAILVTTMGLAAIGCASAAVVIIVAQLGLQGRPRAAPGAPPAPPPASLGTERARLAAPLPATPLPAAPLPATPLPATEFQPLNEFERELAEARIAATLLRGRLLAAEQRLAEQDAELALLRERRPVTEVTVAGPRADTPTLEHEETELPAAAAAIPFEPVAEPAEAETLAEPAASTQGEAAPELAVEPVLPAPEPPQVAELPAPTPDKQVPAEPADAGLADAAGEPTLVELALALPPRRAAAAPPAGPAPTPPPPAAARAPWPPTRNAVARVFIHHHDRPADAGLLAQALPRNIVLAEIRPVGATPERPAVRFYHPADRAAAEALAHALSARTGHAYRPYDFSWFRPPAAPGTLEVWIPPR